MISKRARKEKQNKNKLTISGVEKLSNLTRTSLTCFKYKCFDFQKKKTKNARFLHIGPPLLDISLDFAPILKIK